MNAWLFLLGLLAGARHALEADHLAAVGAIAARERRPLAVLGVGLCWGVGHTLAIMAAATVFALTGFAPPATLVGVAEAVAGGVLLLLGLGLVRRLRQRGWHLHVHRHGGLPHVHLHVHRHTGTHDHAADPIHASEHAARRALAMGLLHGLAGSGALVAALAAAGGGVAAALARTAAFGVGSILAMGTLAVGFGAGVAHLVVRRPGAVPVVRRMLGAGAVAAGAWMVLTVLTEGGG